MTNPDSDAILLHSATPETTAAVAERLAACCPDAAVVYLEGELGAVFDRGTAFRDLNHRIRRRRPDPQQRVQRKGRLQGIDGNVAGNPRDRPLVAPYQLRTETRDFRSETGRIRGLGAREHEATLAHQPRLDRPLRSEQQLIAHRAGGHAWTIHEIGFISMQHFARGGRHPGSDVRGNLR